MAESSDHDGCLCLVAASVMSCEVWGACFKSQCTEGLRSCMCSTSKIEGMYFFIFNWLHGHPCRALEKL